jgi:hypothetical protein
MAVVVVGTSDVGTYNEYGEQTVVGGKVVELTWFSLDSTTLLLLSVVPESQRPACQPPQVSVTVASGWCLVARALH